MTLYEALKMSRVWGDTIELADGKITVTKAEAPAMGVIVSVPKLAMPDHKPRTADAKRVWKTAAHFGRDLEAGMVGGKLVLSHPDRGQATLPTAPSRLAVPTAPDSGWATLSPTVLARVQQAASVASEDEHLGYGLNGVRVTPDYVAASNGTIIAVVWSVTGLSDPVTLPTAPLRKMNTDDGAEFTTTKAHGWFRSGDCLHWTSLVATPWPDNAVNTMIPDRRDAVSVTVKIPDGWLDGVKGAALTDHSADNPARVQTLTDTVVLSINDVFYQSWEVEGATEGVVVGANAHLLLRATKMLPEGEDAYLSVPSSPTMPFLLYTSGTDAVEVLVSPHYLPA